jgi:hypothetical protein
MAQKPNHPVLLFHKSMLLLSLERYNDALAQANQLKDSCPQEPAVYFLLSKIHQKVSESQFYILCLVTAMGIRTHGEHVGYFYIHLFSF